MTISETGKYLYWTPGETVDVRLTELYNVRKYGRNVEDYVIGEAVWKHFKKGESPIICTNDRKCGYCKTGMKPIIRFSTSVIFADDGEEYFCEMPISLSRILAEKQVAWKEAGMSEEDILSKTFRIRKFKDVIAPYWEVKVIDNTAKKTKKRTVNLDELDDEDVDEVVNDETDAEKEENILSPDEVDMVDDLVAKLDVKISKNPDYDWKALAEKTLKKELKDSEKVAYAMELVKSVLEESD